MVEGGLYTDQKFKKIVAGVKNPELKLLSPMQRFAWTKKYADDDEAKYPPFR